MSSNPTLDNKLDRKPITARDLAIFIVEYEFTNPEARYKSHQELIDKYEQAIKSLILEERIDELNKYNEHYDQDYDNYITDRINQLNAIKESSK